MDFFARQDQARRHTTLLVLYFVVAVILIVTTLNIVAAAIVPIVSGGARTWNVVTNQDTSPRSGYRAPPPMFEPQSGFFRADVVAYVTLGTLLVIAGGCLFKVAQLSRGGRAVAEMLGARPVSPNTTDAKQRVLRDVVEEMSIAAGIPPPAVYLLTNEQGINAFAAGFSQRDAVVCVTQGCLDKLTRDELQAVIAHEFSHILNGDMSLNVRLIGALYGILLIGLIGYGVIRGVGSSSSSDSKDGGLAVIISLFVIGLVLMIVGYVGLFFGRVIQAAVCRQREFLADAAAIQFTRNPTALSGALRRLGDSSFGSRIDDHNAEQLAHMFFGSSKGAEWDWFATHPQVGARIKAVDPSWDGAFPKPSGPTTLERYGASAVPARGGPGAGIPVSASSIVRTFAAPTPMHVQWASDFLSSVPPVLDQAARDPFAARALVFALLLSNEPSVRQKQVDLLNQFVDAATVQTMLKLSDPAAQYGPRGRRVLTDLALPALRHLSGPQCEQFSKAVQAMIDADSRVTLYEYMLHQILVKYLTGPSSGPRAPQIAYVAFKPLLADIQIILSALAHADDKPQPAADEAFRAGWGRLQQGPELFLLNSVDMKLLDGSLQRLSQSAPVIKRRVVDACAFCVAADGMVQTEEGELLRAITTMLDCPLPPLLGQHEVVPQPA